MSVATVVAHTVVVLAILAGYIALTVVGDDGTALLGVLGGYIGGTGTQAAIGYGQRAGG